MWRNVLQQKLINIEPISYFGTYQCDVGMAISLYSQ